jgi:aminocarboxymuconate-semialdehyde decarboxylase
MPARNRHLVVDLHCHIAVPEADTMAREAGVALPQAFATEASRVESAAAMARIRPALTGIEQRLCDMDATGVDVQAISPFPGQYYYEAPAELGRDLARRVNEGVAAAVATRPDRLVGMGTVPLQCPEFAIAELRHCVRNLDLRGIEINTNVAGRELSDPAFAGFFAAAEELGTMLFLHPTGYTHGDRLCDFMLNTIIGAPFDTTVTLSQLIFSGLFETYPDLHVCAAHGGGFLPAYWGRLDRAYATRADCRAHITRAPSTYLRQIWADTLVFDKAELEALVLAHGADRLCMGTDYPFELGEPDPVGFHDSLGESARERILGGNAADLLGLVAVHSPPRAS